MRTINLGAGPADVIEVHKSETSDDLVVIEVRSNLSMTLDRLAAVFLGLSAVALLVALGPTIMGYWPIMLATVIHLILIGWCLRLAWRGNWARERVLIGRREVIIEHFDVRRQNRSSWPTGWLQVEVEPGPMGERQVAVTCKGRRQIIGSFVPVQERLKLAEILEKSLRPRSGGGSD